MYRKLAIALSFVTLILAPKSIRAQAPSSSATSAEDQPFRDFENEPPTKLGTKLSPTKGWDSALRPALIRTHSPPTLGGGLVSHDKCELLVKDDWLRVWCKGPTGRVHQLAGDTGDVVVHISNQLLRDAKGGQDDRRRLALYVRLVPGNVTVLEVTAIGTGGYNGDWEGQSSLLTVDWSDTKRGPRIHIAEPGVGYMF